MNYHGLVKHPLGTSKIYVRFQAENIMILAYYLGKKKQKQKWSSLQDVSDRWKLHENFSHVYSYLANPSCVLPIVLVVSVSLGQGQDIGLRRMLIFSPFGTDSNDNLTT